KSSGAPIGREDSWCFRAVGSSNAPLLGSTAAEGLPRIGRTSIATHWRSCGLPQSASCSENFVTPPDVFGQTLRARFLLLDVYAPSRILLRQRHHPVRHVGADHSCQKIWQLFRLTLLAFTDPRQLKLHLIGITIEQTHPAPCRNRVCHS